MHSVSKQHLSLLVDTNVWLDYLLGREGAEDAVRMLQTADAREDAVAVTPSIMKDAFFLICATLKRRIREEGRSVNEEDARAITQIGWSCLLTMQHAAIVLDQGFQAHLGAMALRDQHEDYEDDLLLATAQDAKVSYLITKDQKLLSNGVVKALTPRQYVALCEEQGIR